MMRKVYIQNKSQKKADERLNKIIQKMKMFSNKNTINPHTIIQQQQVSEEHYKSNTNKNKFVEQQQNRTKKKGLILAQLDMPDTKTQKKSYRQFNFPQTTRQSRQMRESSKSITLNDSRNFFKKLKTQPESQQAFIPEKQIMLNQNINYSHSLSCLQLDQSINSQFSRRKRVKHLRYKLKQKDQEQSQVKMVKNETKEVKQTNQSNKAFPSINVHYRYHAPQNVQTPKAHGSKLRRNISLQLPKQAQINKNLQKLLHKHHNNQQIQGIPQNQQFVCQNCQKLARKLKNLRGNFQTIIEQTKKQHKKILKQFSQYKQNFLITCKQIEQAFKNNFQLSQEFNYLRDIHQTIQQIDKHHPQPENSISCQIKKFNFEQFVRNLSYDIQNLIDNQFYSVKKPNSNSNRSIGKIKRLNIHIPSQRQQDFPTELHVSSNEQKDEQTYHSKINLKTESSELQQVKSDWLPRQKSIYQDINANI